MRQLTRFAVIAAFVAASISCGDVVRDGRSPVYLVIDSLQAARGDQPSFSTGPFSSPVVTAVTSGGTCSSASPCAVVFNDLGQALLHAPLKDVTSVTGPTSNQEVTITRYHVSYKRTDGRNTQGVDVPYAFDGAATATILPGATLALPFELVRHVAKEQAPLVHLRSSTSVISTIAEITFYGTDRVGNAITVTGTITVNFGDFSNAGGGGVCGNSVIEIGETCDDGNTQSGDGCSATCQSEGD